MGFQKGRPQKIPPSAITSWGLVGNKGMHFIGAILGL